MSRFTLTDVISDILGGVAIPERSENWMTRCPLPTHPERDPSFSINLDKGLWLCHACGERGGISKLARIMEMEVDEDDIAVRRALELARSSGFEEPIDFWEDAVRWRLDVNESIPAEVRSFCVSRGINKPALFQYGIGWEPGRRRIVFPYWDDDKCVGLKYRYVDHEGDKKRNKGSATGSKRSILGLNEVRGTPVVLLCEGESDTLALWSYLNRHGMTEGVAVGGVPGADNTADRWELWALDLLWSSRVYMAFDGDAAGDKGAATAMRVLGDKAVRLRPPDGMDIAGYLADGNKLSDIGLSRRDIQAVTFALHNES